MAAATPLIFLPGALGALEGADEAARRLAASRHMSSIAYRPDDRLDGVLDRIEAAANEMGASQVDLLGQSYGGWIARCAARRFPDRIRRIVLSHSFVLQPRHAWRFRLGMTVLGRLPPALLRPLLLKRVRQALAPLRAVDPARAKRQLAALSPRIGNPDLRAILVAQQRCMLDSLEAPFASRPPVDPALPVLIIESANDPLVGARARDALRASLPQAERHSFTGSGHISAMVEPDAYVARVARFLDDPK